MPPVLNNLGVILKQQIGQYIIHVFPYLTTMQIMAILVVKFQGRNTKLGKLLDFEVLKMIERLYTAKLSLWVNIAHPNLLSEQLSINLTKASSATLPPRMFVVACL